MKTIFALILTIGTTSVFANNETDLMLREIEREVDICMEQDSSTYGMRLCLDKEASELDRLLNKTYKRVKSKLGKTEVKLLVKSQRDWLKYRTSNCEFAASSFLEGTAETITLMSCSNGMTAKKIVELNNHIAN